MREATITRKTKETQISVSICLEGGEFVLNIPSGFLTHMLDALAKHAGLGLRIDAAGDVHVDLHHTVEDIGIVLGKAIKGALGEKRGITRYGLAKVPMDEALVEACIDLSGRPFFIVHGGEVFHGKAGDLDLELVPEFFRPGLQRRHHHAHDRLCLGTATTWQRRASRPLPALKEAVA